jgi:hypothetical protein
MRPLKFGDGMGKYEAENEYIDEICYRKFIEGKNE